MGLLSIIFSILIFLNTSYTQNIELRVTCMRNSSCQSGSQLIYQNQTTKIQQCSTNSCNIDYSTDFSIQKCEYDLFGQKCATQMCLFAEQLSTCLSQDQYCGQQLLIGIQCKKCQNIQCASGLCSVSWGIQNCIEQEQCFLESYTNIIKDCQNQMDIFGNSCACCIIIKDIVGPSLGICIDQQQYNQNIFGLLGKFLGHPQEQPNNLRNQQECLQAQCITLKCQDLPNAVQENDDGTCVCTQMYEWNIQSSSCQLLNCQNRPYVTDQTALGICNCIQRYQWNPKLHQCQLLKCKGRARVIDQQAEGYCVCQRGYQWNMTNNQCQLILCGQKEHVVDPTSVYQCQCQNGYQWNVIEKECTFLLCKGKEHILDQTEIFSCTCQSGYIWNADNKACQEVNL